MTKQDSAAGKQWYVIHTYSGYEDAVKRALEQRTESMNMGDFVFEVLVPKEKVLMTKGRSKEPVVVDKILFPGYVLVEMIVTDASWFMVRNTPNVTGFVGSGNTPVPVLPEEFGIIKRRMGDDKVSAEIKLREGDLVKVTEGPFANYEGSISEINNAKGKVIVLLSIFDRDTPIELDFNQVQVQV